MKKRKRTKKPTPEFDPHPVIIAEIVAYTRHLDTAIAALDERITHCERRLAAMRAAMLPDPRDMK